MDSDRTRSARLVVAAVALCVLVGSGLAASADGAKPPQKQPNQVPYRLTVKFDGSYEMNAAGGGQTGHELRDFSFAGSSGRFLLIRSGTASKPLYTIADARGTPLMLHLTGPLGFTGSSHHTDEQGCWFDETWRIEGENYAAVDILLIRNRLYLSISSDVILHYHVVIECYGRSTRDSTSSSLLLSPKRDDEAAWSWKIDPLTLKQVRFGKSFPLTLRRDPNGDPTLHRTFNNGQGVQDWFYTWQLRFTRV